MKFNLSILTNVFTARSYLEELINKGVPIELREMKPKRSLDANGLYWVWLTCIEIETGLNRNECHLLYRCLFIPRDEEDIISIIRGDTLETIHKFIDNFQYFNELPIIADIISKSTTELDESQFYKYLTNIKNHARENMWVILLSKDEKNFYEFYKEYGFR